MEEQEKDQTLRARRIMSIREVLEEAEVVVDTHFYDEFSKKLLGVSEDGSRTTRPLLLRTIL